jgi:YD repeat-containing protein
VYSQDILNKDNWTDTQLKQWEDSIRQSLLVNLAIDSTASIVKKPTDTPNLITAVADNTHVPNSYAINQGFDAGEIPYTSGVSSSGAMTYTVPIEVYPGIRGMQPQLSVSYNHLSGNGLVGFGWNIGGLSAISRTARSIHYDGSVNGIELTKDDAFVLDGIRLIKISETSTQIKYETEQGNIKVNANLSGNVVKYFEALYPNGNRGIFGYAYNSSNYSDYPLTTLTDLHGNAITYTYTYSNNHYKINQISYANASVVFQYDSRPDNIVYYNVGLKVTENQLLQHILCKYNGNEIGAYHFTYQTQQNNSVLTQIGRSISTHYYNPLIFYYGEGKTAYAYTTASTQLQSWYVNSDPKQLRLTGGKFDYGTDNDGLISFPNNISYYNHYRHSTALRHSQNTYVNLYTGTETIYLYTGLSNSYANATPTLTTEAGFIDVFCTNLDGIWEDEIIKINNVVSGNNDQLTFKVYSANLYNGIASNYTRTFNFSTVVTDADGGKSIHPKFYFPGDFNGDGKMEILAVSCHNPIGNTNITTKCYLFDLESNTKLYEGYAFPFIKDFVTENQTDLTIAEENSDKIYILDYDGDGKSDICLINNSGTKIYKFVVSGTTYSLQLVSTYTGLTKTNLINRTLLVGELNGDGKHDFLLSPPSNNSSDYTWKIYNSMGNGQFDMTSCSSANNYSGAGFFTQDIDGDGISDVIKTHSDLYMTYMVSNNEIPYIADGNATTSYTNNSNLAPLNIHSGNYYQLAYLKNGVLTKLSYPRNDTKEKLLTGSISSLGVVQKYYYGMLNDRSGHYYAEGFGAVFPYTNFTGQVYFPIATEQYFNGLKNEDFSHSYENAVLHKQGLGFRGFERINAYDNIRSHTSTTKTEPHNYGMVKEEESSFVKNLYAYTISVQSNKLVKIRMTSSSSQDKLKNSTVSSIYTYDTYGNPTAQSVSYGGTISESIASTYYNNTNEANYFLGFLTDRTKTTNRNGSTSTERDYIPSYHSSKALANEGKHYFNGNMTGHESFTYNAQGNVTQKGIKTYTSTTNLTTSYSYDSYGRITSETNPLGFTTSYTYNTAGRLASEVNHKGQSRTYSYDSFGRVAVITNPDGVTENSSYFWSSLGTNGVYARYHCTMGQPWTKIYYDALGREVSRGDLLFDNSELRTDKLYDSYGHLWKVSMPFTESSASAWNVYQYDSYDRPTTITEASGRTTSYSYGENSVTTTQDGIASTQTYDAQGNLTQAVDPAGTITYTLRPDGQPSSIVAPDNVTTSFTYDSYGRQTGIVDPSAGTQTYGYDAAGNLSSEQNGNGQTTIYLYDNYNRPTGKATPEWTSYYTYNTDGRLASERLANGISTTYTYDTYGRLLTETDSVPDNKWCYYSA